MDRTAVIIVNFSNTQDTLSCLNSLAKATAPFSVYVVHYAKNHDRNKLKAHKIQPHIIDVEENRGFAGFNNVGLAKAFVQGAQAALLLNNDTLVDPSFLKPLVTRAKQKKVGLVSPKIYFAKGYETHKYPQSDLGKVIWYGGGVIDWNNVYAFHRHVDEVDRGQVDTPQETNFATGCALALTKKTYQKIGPLPEKYFIYLEDVAWSLKAKQQGLQVWYEPTSIVWHKNAQSSQGPGSDIHVYYQTRNRILFAKEFAPTSSKLAVLREAFRLWRAETGIRQTATWHGLIGKTGFYQLAQGKNT